MSQSAPDHTVFQLSDVYVSCHYAAAALNLGKLFHAQLQWGQALTLNAPDIVQGALFVFWLKGKKLATGRGRVYLSGHLPCKRKTLNTKSLGGYFEAGPPDSLAWHSKGVDLPLPIRVLGNKNDTALAPVRFARYQSQAKRRDWSPWRTRTRSKTDTTADCPLGRLWNDVASGLRRPTLTLTLALALALMPTQLLSALPFALTPQSYLKTAHLSLIQRWLRF